LQRLGGLAMFNIGDRIAYPVHGAGVIEAIEEQTILGEIRKYYVMRMPLNDMKVMIPMENVAEIGVRPIISLEDVGRVFSVLSADVTKMPQNWNRRYRANMDHIKSGDIFEVAEVVRNLMLRDREKSLSTGERKILNNARQILLSEIILAGNLQEVEVNDMIENVIK
jgi:CarD family transcriptional regulator